MYKHTARRMLNTSAIVLGPLAFAVMPPRPAAVQRDIGRTVDTVDVAVGSPLISGDRMEQFRTHIKITPSAMPPGAPPLEYVNTMTQFDSMGIRIIRVVSQPNTGPGYSLLFKRSTLESLTVARGPRPPQADSAFLGNWADFIVERLPRKTDVVYRVPMFQPGPGGFTIVKHLYQTVGREDIVVLGKTIKQAWVVEDHSSDGKTLLGRMYVVAGPPYLVRWTMMQPNGVTVQIDQEVMK